MIGFRYVPAGNEFTLLISKACGGNIDVFIAPDCGGLVQQLGCFTCSAANSYISLGINRSRVDILQFIVDLQLDIGP